MATDLYPDAAGPATAGTAVTWTARATDPDGDAILYKFCLKARRGLGLDRYDGMDDEQPLDLETVPSDAGTSSVCVA